MNTDQVLAWLRASLAEEHHSESVDDVLRMVAERRAQVWFNDTGVVVTEVTPDGPDVVLTYWIIGGSLRGALALQNDIERWAKAAGCTEARIAPRRPGWTRVGRALGFEDMWLGVMGRRL